MSKNNKVTVLTLVYNGMPYLKDAIESTLNQTYKNFDYVIIDDVSTDDSVACIKSYKDPRITFIQNEKNLNTSDSFNKALTLIKTEYIVRLDQDDISDVNRLQKQIDFLDANKGISIISSWEKIINSKGILIMNWRGNIKNYGDIEFLNWLKQQKDPSIAFFAEIIHAPKLKKQIELLRPKIKNMKTITIDKYCKIKKIGERKKEWLKQIKNKYGNYILKFLLFSIAQ